MAQMYISTDAREANSILGFQRYPFLDISNLDINSGEQIKSKIGFNPMSWFNLNGTPINDARKMAVKLVKEGLQVVIALDSDQYERYFLEDIVEREQLVQLSLMAEKAESQMIKYSWLVPSYAIMRYSNDSSKIRPFLTEFF